MGRLTQKNCLNPKNSIVLTLKHSVLCPPPPPPPINGSKIQCGESSLKVFIFLQETGSYSVISLVHKKNI